MAEDNFESEKPRRGRPKSWHDSQGKGIVQSLDRALDLLAHLSAVDGATLTELARRANMPASSVYRTLSTFEKHGVVENDEAEQRWFIGAEAFRLGATFLRRTNLPERAGPVLRALVDETGETANLGIEREGQVVFLRQVETHQMIRAFFPPGTVSSLHASGIGKAILAFLPERRLEAVLRRLNLHQFTDKTLTSPQALRAEIGATRTRGFAVDDEERASGMRCVAAPIRNMLGEAVAGISVSGPTHRLPDAEIARFGALVAEKGEELSRSIGWQGG